MERCPLSPRQLETMRLLALGLTWRQVAERMGVKLSTVTTHGYVARKKLGAHTNSEAVVLCERHGWLDADSPDESKPGLSPAARLYLEAFDELLADRRNLAAQAKVAHMFRTVCLEAGLKPSGRDRRLVHERGLDRLLKDIFD